MFEEVDQETAEQVLQNAIRLKEQMETLKKDVNFQRLTQELKKQIEQRSAAVFGFPDGGLDTVVKNIYTSGEVAGLRMTVDFVDILIDSMQSTIDVDKARKAAKENENG